ncbi:MAG: glycosyltransferase family 4 protein [Gammaproteobacteria bacterium]|nr:glycosyltransferase family 4 protein [Gammaproteobacteria bacterium]
MLSPATEAADYAGLLTNRIAFNKALQSQHSWQGSAWILGLDYDGFALPRLPQVPFIASARALFADIAPTEPEPFRSMLQQQAELEKQNFQSAAAVTVPSAYAKRGVCGYYDISPAKVHVIPNAVDIDEWDALTRSNVPQPAEVPTLLAVGKLFPRKRIDMLLRAMPLIRRAVPDAQLRIVGDGQQWDDLQQLTRELGIADAVSWLGNLSRTAVAREFAASHVFVHPSVQETFGNVCLEAMAARRPLLVVNAASLPEIVGAADSGVIVPPDNPQALADAAIALLSDPEERQRLGANGRRYAERWSWQAVARCYLDLAESLMAAG